MSLTPTMSLPRALTSSSRSAPPAQSWQAARADTAAAAFARLFTDLALPVRPQKHVTAVDRQQARHRLPRPAARTGLLGRPVNLPLGLTFYCSDLVRRHGRSEPVRASARCIDPRRAFSLSRRSRRAGRRRLLDHHVGSSSDTTGSIRAEAAPRSNVEWRQEMESWGARYRANPRRSRRRRQIRPGAARHRPARAGRRRARTGGDPQSGGPRACSAPMAGRWPTTASFQQALDVLNRAHTQDQPDWRILSVQGAVLDQMGRHAEAQRTTRARCG